MYTFNVSSVCLSDVLTDVSAVKQLSYVTAALLNVKNRNMFFECIIVCISNGQTMFHFNPIFGIFFSQSVRTDAIFSLKALHVFRSYFSLTLSLLITEPHKRNPFYASVNITFVTISTIRIVTECFICTKILKNGFLFIYNTFTITLNAAIIFKSWFVYGRWWWW